MRRPMKYTLSLLLSVSATVLFAQTPQPKELLDKVTDFYKEQDRYRVNMTFTLLRGLEGNKAVESYKGSMEKSNDYHKNSIQNTEVYTFPEGQIILDNTQYTISYSPKASAQAHDETLQVSNFLKYYEKSQVKDSGDSWVCEMVSARKNFGQLPYGKVVLYIRKKDYSIAKQVLFFANLIPFTSDDGKRTEQDMGRLEIVLDHQWNEDIEPKELSSFVTRSAVNQLQVQPAYAAYKLINRSTYN